MTYSRADLALCASRTRALAEQLGDAGRDALIAEWADLLAELENPRTNAALALADYRAGIEQRLATRQLHTPLEVAR